MSLKSCCTLFHFTHHFGHNDTWTQIHVGTMTRHFGHSDIWPQRRVGTMTRRHNGMSLLGTMTRGHNDMLRLCLCVRVCVWGGGGACVRRSKRGHVLACLRVHVCEHACECVRVCVCVCLSTRICISASSEWISFGFGTNMPLELVYRFLSKYFDYFKVKVIKVNY